MLAKHLEKKEQEGGFTLVELLVVILIIGILAAVAIPAFLNQRKRANDAAVESDVKNLATQIESALIAAPNGEVDAVTGARGSVVVNIVDSTGATLSSTDTVTLSDGVTIDVTAGGANGSEPGTYTITGNHDNGTKTVTYDSTAGGLD